MSKFKAAAGIIVLVGVPLALGLFFAALGYGYANQHVHDVWAELQGTEAVVKVNDYDHSTGGIAAMAGVLAFGWVVITMLMVLLGGTMIARRNQRWD